jgi:hypothetical protein
VPATPANGRFSGSIRSGRGGIAYVTPRGGGGFDTTVRYGTVAELQDFDAVYCLGTHRALLEGRRRGAGAAPADQVYIGMGTANAPALGGTTSLIFPDGVLDLIAGRTTREVVTKLFAQRGLSGATLGTVTVNFGGPNAADPVTAPLYIRGMGADLVYVTYTYRTSNRTSVRYANDQFSTSIARTIAGFPAVAGSFHQARVISQPTHVGNDRIRSVDVAFEAVGPKTLTLGPEMAPVTVTRLSTSPSLRLQAVIPAMAPYHQSWNFTMTQGTGAHFRSATVQATSATRAERRPRRSRS